MLTTLGTWLLNTLLAFLWSKLGVIVTALVSSIVAAIAKWKRDEIIAKEQKQSEEPLKQAQTGKEIDDASKDAAGGF